MSSCARVLAMDRPETLDRYLGLLGLPARRPSLDALAELTAAHLMRIPFENVSKLYYRHDLSSRGVPGLARFLDGIERYRFGGTCYANNFHFGQLLAHLGYRATLCGADMNAPDVHIVNLVAVDGRRYLVDVGYGAPFLEPLPLDATEDQEIVWGAYRHVLRPAGAGQRPRLDLYREDVLKHRYVLNPAARRIEEFADIIAESFAEHATFMNALLISRFGKDHSTMLRNLTLIRSEGTAWHLSEIAEADQLPGIIEREFGMPRDVVRLALDGVRLTAQP